MSLSREFWDRVDKTGDCWEWTAGKHSKGYGVAWNGDKVELAHRIVYRSEIGEIDEGMCVCHKCDNPGCVNPQHLFLGTNDDNMRDRDRKGRVAHGDTHYKSRLSSKDAVQIKSRLQTGERQRDIAMDFGVCRATISAISTGRTWKRAN